MFVEPELPMAPERLPRPGEVPVLGAFKGRTGDVDTSAWDHGLRRRMQRKTWVYTGVYSERCYVGLAIVDAGFLATAFVYVYDRTTGQLMEHKASKPFGFGAKWQPGLDTPWNLSHRRNHWSIVPSPGKSGGWIVTFTGPALDLRVEFDDSPAGLSVLAPAHDRPFHYTYKLAGVPARLQLTTADTAIAEDTRGVIDFSKGYPPRHMYWNWASLVGATSDGESFGLNLVADFNNGLENAAWFGERLLPLSQAVFQYDRRNIREPWHIRTLDGRVDLQFHPEGLRAEDISVGLMASRFAQPFGYFEGRVVVPSGEEQWVSGHGVVEQHLAVW